MRISDWSSDGCSSDLDGRAVAEPVCVRQSHRGFEIRHAHDGQDRAEDLLAVDLHLRRNLVEQAAAEPVAAVVALELQAAPVDDQLRALAHAFVHIGGDLRSEEHTSELQSLMRISYAVFCLNKKIKTPT